MRKKSTVEASSLSAEIQRLSALLDRIGNSLKVNPGDFKRQTDSIVMPLLNHGELTSADPKSPPVQSIDDILSVAEEKANLFIMFGNQFPRVSFLDNDVILTFKLTSSWLSFGTNEEIELTKSSFNLKLSTYREFIQYFYKCRDFITNDKVCRFIDEDLNFPIFAHFLEQPPNKLLIIRKMGPCFYMSNLFERKLKKNFDFERLFGRFYELFASQFEGFQTSELEIRKLGMFLYLAENNSFFNLFFIIEEGIIYTNGPNE